jgi:hypothetical protein
MTDEPIVQQHSGEEVASIVTPTVTGPHVEVATGENVKVPLVQAGTELPHVEHSNPIPGDTPEKKSEADLVSLPSSTTETFAITFDAVEYFKRMSMTPEAQDALLAWQENSAILGKLMSNPVMSGIIALHLKIV